MFHKLCLFHEFLELTARCVVPFVLSWMVCCCHTITLSHCHIVQLMLTRSVRRSGHSRLFDTAKYEHLHVSIGTAQSENLGFVAGGTARDMLTVIQAKGMGEPCSPAGTEERCVPELRRVVPGSISRHAVTGAGMPSESDWHLGGCRLCYEHGRRAADDSGSDAANRNRVRPGVLRWRHALAHFWLLTSTSAASAPRARVVSHS